MFFSKPEHIGTPKFIFGSPVHRAKKSLDFSTTSVMQNWKIQKWNSKADPYRECEEGEARLTHTLVGERTRSCLTCGKSKCDGPDPLVTTKWFYCSRTTAGTLTAFTVPLMLWTKRAGFARLPPPLPCAEYRGDECPFWPLFRGVCIRRDGADLVHGHMKSRNIGKITIEFFLVWSSFKSNLKQI